MALLRVLVHAPASADWELVFASHFLDKRQETEAWFKNGLFWVTQAPGILPRWETVRGGANML